MYWCKEKLQECIIVAESKFYRGGNKRTHLPVIKQIREKVEVLMCKTV